MSDPAFEAFVNTELPRRSAHLNFAITGYDADPNDGGAPAIITNAPVGTWFREQTAGRWWRKTETLWQDQSSGGAGGGALIYQPGSGENGPVIYDAWADLMTALNAQRTASGGNGKFIIGFSDQSLAGPFQPIIIPAGGPYDMTGVTWDGGFSRGGANVHMADGATFTNLRSFDNGIFLRNLNTVTPADNSLGAGFWNTEVIFATRGCDISGGAGGQPIWGNANLSPGQFVIFKALNRTTVGNNSAGPIFDIPAGSFLILEFGLGSRAEASRTDLFVGAIGAILLTQQAGHQRTRKTYPTWLGTIFAQNIDIPAALLPNPLWTSPASQTAVTASFGNMLRLDGRGAGINQNLPRINTSNTPHPGSLLTAVEVGNKNGVTLQPQAGDTVAGARYAKGVLTLAANPANGETVVIAGRAYTFEAVFSNTVDFVLIGGTASDSLDNLINAINAGPGSGVTYGAGTTVNVSVSALAGDGDTMLLTAKALGTTGNAVTTMETLAAVGSQFAAGTLLGGTNGTVKIPAGGGVVLQNDGINHWSVVGRFDPNDPVKEKWFGPFGTTPIADGNHVGLSISANGVGNAEFAIPEDFKSLESLELILTAAQVHAAADIDLLSDYGAVGESPSIHSEADLISTYALVPGVLLSIDLSSVFTLIQANDICGLEINNTGVNGGTVILSIRMRYNALQ